MLTIEPTDPRSIAGIAAFKDRDRFLAAMKSEFGLTMPVTPSTIQAGGVAISCLAPGRYMATADRGADLPARLANVLTGLAAITDQSDQWVTFVVSGEQSSDVLARLVPVDLGAAQFGVGVLALTRAGHLDVRLWRVAEQTYEIAVTRSMSDDLHHALEQARLSK